MSGANYTPENIRDDEESRGLRAKVRNNLNYISLALNSIQSYFASALQEVSDRIIKPALRGGFLVNDVRYSGTLPTAVNAIPTASNQTVLVTAPLAITDNLTVPANVSLVVLKGGSFAITAGKTLTINGPFDACGNALSDIFSGSGSYAFGKAVRLTGAGTPESVVTAPIGSEFLRTDGSTGTTIYIKESGTGNTGWAAPGSGAVTGTGVSGRVAYWNGTASITSDSAFTFGSSQLAAHTLLADTNIYLGKGSSGSQLRVYGGNAVDVTVPSSTVTNMEWVSLYHDGATAFLKVDKNGTGTYRDLQVNVGSSNRFQIAASGGLADFPAGDVRIRRSNPGGIVQLSVINNSSAASSHALVYISNAGGASGADSILTWDTPSVITWSMGSDWSDFASLVISESSALGTSNRLRIASGGAVSVVAGNLDVTRSQASGVVSVLASNTSNTGSANAAVIARIGGSSGGDPVFVLDAGASGAYGMGYDRSAGKFCIGFGYGTDGSSFPGTFSWFTSTGSRIGLGLNRDPDVSYAVDIGQSAAGTTSVGLGNGSGPFDLHIYTGGAGSDAAFIVQSGGTGGTIWTFGPDASDSNTFKWDSGTSSIGGNTRLQISTSGIVTVLSTTDSTSTTTGAVIVSGGLGLAKALWVGGLANIAGVATFANTTDASAVGTAGTVVVGGLGIAKKIYLGDDLNAAGDVKINTVGKGLYVKEGTNATMGTATLVLGVATVSTTKVTANSRIFLTAEALGTIASPVAVSVTARTAGTSFTITSANLTDTSTIAWMIVEPA